MIGSSKRLLIVALAVGLLAWATWTEAAPAGETTGPSFGHRMAWYIPNRLLDLVDLLRLRGRAGLGNALSLRVTEPASVFVGSYNTVYVGFPGPRYPERWKWPAGHEQYVGLSVGVVDATDEGRYEPGYTKWEVGLGFELLLLGIDVGTDPVEWWDFIAGLVTVDPRGDDL